MHVYCQVSKEGNKHGKASWLVVRQILTVLILNHSQKVLLQISIIDTWQVKLMCASFSDRTKKGAVPQLQSLVSPSASSDSCHPRTIYLSRTKSKISPSSGSWSQEWPAHPNRNHPQSIHLYSPLLTTGKWNSKEEPIFYTSTINLVHSLCKSF